MLLFFSKFKQETTNHFFTWPKDMILHIVRIIGLFQKNIPIGGN